MAKPRSKTEKKIDNNIRQALTVACDHFLEDIPGFQWLTHQVNYTNYPASLLITCVFDTMENSKNADIASIQKLVLTKLLKIGVKLKSPERQIIFDSEEACTMENAGQWAERLEKTKGRALPKNRP
ncbi:Fis family transcriptional regulator [uncultured Pseudoteredinibacter sp.]|uniref:Fis family transcriptional regulator n=1 Tax=uncultured Pseudoteredinibacter sp. TaxID=1641701 RepID=UPI00261A4575|nr:Fis family transcriptional regulator [uncultured Pseudoteredinibacter sp.]